MTTKNLLSQRDITEEYGLSKSTVWGRVRDGKLTPLRSGRIVRFRRDEVEALFAPVAKAVGE
jgi:excisionase family DNA binding protein